MDKGGQGEKPRIVVDASVAVKWVIEGTLGSASENPSGEHSVEKDRGLCTDAFPL